MGKMMFAMGSIEFAGDGTEALKAVGQLLERVLPSQAGPMLAPAMTENPQAEPIAAIEHVPAVKPRKKWTRRVKTEDNGEAVAAKPKRTWSRRKKAAVDPIDEIPSGPLADTTSRTTAEQVERRAKANAPSMADRIAELLGKHKKLSKVQIAMKLLTSEKAIAIAIGHARGRFVMDEDLNFSLAE